MSEQEDLATIAENIRAILVEITANPKPSYSINGKSVSWESYKTSLMNDLRSLREMSNEDPFEISSIGYTC
jgi:hypothetical protein